MKYNILIHAINWIGIGHIQRTLLIAKELKKKKEVGSIIFVSNTKNPSFITDEGFECIYLEHGIEDTLTTIDFETYENTSSQTIHNIIQSHDIGVILHDTFFLKPIVREYRNLKHFLILRDSEESYLKSIEDSFPLFKKILLPHPECELSEQKKNLYKNHTNIHFCWYVTKISPKSQKNKKKKILVSPGYGWDYENTVKFFQHVLNLFKENAELLKDYNIQCVLGKHYDLLVKEISFPDDIELSRFKENFVSEIQESEIFLWRAGYNTVNEIIFQETKWLLFPVERFGENQANRINFFSETLGINFIRQWLYTCEDTDSLRFLMELTEYSAPEEVKELFEWIHATVDFIQTELAKPNILIFKNIFLPMSEHFIHEELQWIQSLNPIIVPLKIENQDRYKNNLEIHSNNHFSPLLHETYPIIQNQQLYIQFLQYILYLIKKFEIRTIYTEFLFDAHFLRRIKKFNPTIRLFSASRGYDAYVFLNHPSIHPQEFLRELDGIFVRDTTMKTLIESHGISQSKVSIIRSVLDLKKCIFKRKDFVSFDILLWGRFVEKKWLLEVLDLIKLLEKEIPIGNIGLVWEGPLRAQIEEKIATLWLSHRIIMYGFLEHSDLLKVIHEYNCYINYSRSSTSWDNEWIPNLMLENMLMGNIVFSTITGWIWDVIQDGITGIALSWDATIDAIRIKENLSKYSLSILSENAQSIVQDVFWTENSIKKLEKILS